ncbi:hypothetical protein IMX26_08100 [Clostridium sp. 'deep sea']|uniref:tetratricopeptide repeat protein n=1 Tax=Clostridium sp. 'deep sea' TaxID=2779445 RepID=UPI00189648F1|nr:hypothetical protein [Clostridium sp. 'deep sea']QOR36756.1 hypothetical protein IMX26_08100 [Clostridium sp. 'deep sea']
MSKNKLSYTVTDVTATKESQVFENVPTIQHSKEVKELEKKIAKDCCNAELWMKKGLGLAKQKLYREAVEAFSKAICLDPFNALLYRHRGHRLLSSYRFYEGAADFELASRIEQNNWNIWYHLGFAYHLIGDFERAEKAYKTCYEMTALDCELFPAIVNWRVINLMEMGEFDYANDLASLVDPKMPCGENFVYRDMIQVYKGTKTFEEVLEIKEKYRFANMEYVTKAYGISRYLALTGMKDEANKIIEVILSLAGDCWSGFGYLAAYCVKNNVGRE